MGFKSVQGFWPNFRNLVKSPGFVALSPHRFSDVLGASRVDIVRLACQVVGACSCMQWVKSRPLLGYKAEGALCLITW